MITTGVPGKVVLSYSTGGTDVKIVCDTIRKVSDGVNISVTQVPIVTYTAENAFAFDVGGVETIDISFSRTQPDIIDDNGTDSSHFSNRKWKRSLVSFINRWQARTDGCKIIFDPFENGLQPAIPIGHDGTMTGLNVYFKTLSTKYVCGKPELLEGEITLTVGSMICDASPVSYSALEQPMTKLSDMYILMSTSDLGASYTIYSGSTAADMDLNCVESYEFTGGSEQPIEFVTMRINKKRLSIVAPDLVDDILPGRNKITINAMGQGTFIVTKCQSTRTEYTITAYGIPDYYVSAELTGDMTSALYGTPFTVIASILTNYDTYGGHGEKLCFVTGKTFLYCFDDANNTWGSQSVSLKRGTPVWHVLNVCAALMRCKLFFSHGIAYLVDTSLEGTSGMRVSSNFAYHDHGEMYLNRDGVYPIAPTDTQKKFINAVTGTPELGNEGFESVHNTIIARASDNSYRIATNNDSITYYGAAKGTLQYDMSAYPNSMIDIFSNNLLKMYFDAEQSISFDFKEIHMDANGDIYWQNYFAPTSRASSITDYSNDLIITNKCNFKIGSETTYRVMRNKLVLSEYVHHFPEGYTTYTFGRMAPTDLTQNTSQIISSLNT